MLPDEWSTTTLQHLSHKPISYGIVQTGDPVEGGIRCIRVVDITKSQITPDDFITTSPEISQSYQRTVLEEDDVIVALRGEIGCCVRVTQELAGCNLTRGLARIAPRQDVVHPPFLIQMLRSPLMQRVFDQKKNGSALQEISIGELRRVTVPIPTLPEQKRIAANLSAWDRAIELTKKLIAAKQQRKAALMQQLLTGRVRLPGFTGKWRHEQIGPYLEECSSRVPSTTALPIYTSSRAGLKPQGEYYAGRTVTNDGEYGVVPINCFVFRHMSDDGLFVFHINQTGGEIAVSKEYPVFRAINLDRHFLLAKLNHTPDFRAFAASQKAGGTRTRLYFSKLRLWKTFLPSLPEQQAIAAVLNTADEEIALLTRKLDALRRQKKGLMQQLLTGKVRVKVTESSGE